MDNLICEYCQSRDNAQSKYHPGTCGHCGAEMTIVYCNYYGKPVTDYKKFIEIIKEAPVTTLMFRAELKKMAYVGAI
jgi:hypothetical protein